MRQDRRAASRILCAIGAAHPGGTGRPTWCARATRRQLHCLAIAGAVTTLVAAPRAAAHLAPSIAQATRFIQQAGDRMMAILNESAGWPEKERQLLDLINEKMDVYGIAHFALGRFWNVASAEQREAYVHLFPVVMLGSLGRSIGVFRGARFSIDHARSHGEWIDIRTTVFRVGNAPRVVDWLIGLPANQIKIVDIIAEGSSLRITQRDDVASFMVRHGNSIALLLDALRRRVAAS